MVPKPVLGESLWKRIAGKRSLIVCFCPYHESVGDLNRAIVEEKRHVQRDVTEVVVDLDVGHGLGVGAGDVVASDPAVHVKVALALLELLVPTHCVGHVDQEVVQVCEELVDAIFKDEPVMGRWLWDHNAVCG